jgi:predicted naringenin-chalcone synthase
MTVRILSIGTATPPGRLTQERTAVLGRTFAPTSVAEGAIEALHRRTRIDTRASVLVDAASGQQSFYPPNDGGDGPTTAARMAVFASESSSLAFEASANALRGAAVEPARVSHLVTVSCTGFASPGVDQLLVKKLGLSAGIGRTHIGFMGCHGALNGIAVAKALASADPAAVVLLCCVELCSLHMHYSDRVDQLIANALFADGAAAAVLAQSTDNHRPEVRACRSWLVPGSADLMSWHIGDNGFVMTLAPKVPERLSLVVPGWMDTVLDSCGLRRTDVGGWAIHPGGPRIVDALASALGMADGSGHDSLEVLRQNGNMSSPTILFILDRMGRKNRPRPWVAMAFGPGLAAEAVVLV